MKGAIQLRTQHYPAYQQLYFGLLLAAVAGSLDAYTYLEHGSVFAGLQTGNLILLGISISNAEWGKVGYYLIALLAFMIGTIIVKALQHLLTQKPFQLSAVILIYELVLMAAVILVGSAVSNVMIIVLLSLAASAQLQQFRQLEGQPFTSIMMTGSIRGLGEGIYESFIMGNREKRLQVKTGALVLLSFLVGAFLAAIFAPWLQNRAVAVPLILLIGAVIYLFKHRRDGLETATEPNFEESDSSQEEPTRSRTRSRRGH